MVTLQQELAVSLGIENKITGQQYLLCGMGEVRANHYHFQETPSRMKTKQSHNQFKLPKLLHKTDPENRTKGRKFPPQRKSNLTGCPTNQIQVEFSFLKPQSNSSSVILCFLPHDGCGWGGRGKKKDERSQRTFSLRFFPLCIFFVITEVYGTVRKNKVMRKAQRCAW